jgi:hypothetical protein
MIQRFENFCLLQSVLALALTHPSNVNLLDHREFLRALTLNQEGLSKGTFSEKFNFLVDFKLLSTFRRCRLLHTLHI